MTTLASHLSTFLREYLPRDRAASTHTCETYAYSLMLLLRFASERLRVTPSQINLAQVDSHQKLPRSSWKVSDSRPS